jgi:hypothetical protein
MGMRRRDDDMSELLYDSGSDTDDDDMPGLINASDADDADTKILLYDEAFLTYDTYIFCDALAGTGKTALSNAGVPLFFITMTTNPD